jgi:hypothetical protein
LNDYLERDTKTVDTSFLGTTTGGAATTRSSPRFAVAGPNGHHVDKTHRDCGYGEVYTHIHDPVKGTVQSPNPPPMLEFSTSRDTSRFPSMSGFQPKYPTGKLPKMNFLKFEGKNSKLWQSRCESYFDMYEVDRNIWVKVASMHFEGLAARWLQSV